ncbi:MAG TPA: hypothetical protein VIH83_00550 [Candidatus Bathyarchaeia archaeon]
MGTGRKGFKELVVFANSLRKEQGKVPELSRLLIASKVISTRGRSNRDSDRLANTSH